MKTLLKRAAVVFVIVFAAAQLVRSDQTNPATDASHALRAQFGPASRVVTVVDRACHRGPASPLKESAP